MARLDRPRPSAKRPGAKWFSDAVAMPSTTGVRVCTGSTPLATTSRSVCVATTVESTMPSWPEVSPSQAV